MSKKKIEELWGADSASLGFCMVPMTILNAHKRLGINPTQFSIILQLLGYWWQKDNSPFPTKKAIAEQIGISPRQVQRNIAALEQAGLIERVYRTGGDKGNKSNVYKLDGFVKKVSDISREIIDAKTDLSTAKKQKKL